MAIRSIPLFPLNLVMLPKMILPLHLFEERYKEMLAYCVDRESPFGIVMLNGVDVTTGEPSYHSVGCTAEFVRVDPTKDGRYNVHVAGEERFRVLDTHDGMDFRMALVETFDDEPSDGDAVLPWAEKAGALLTRFLEKHLSKSGEELGEVDLPDDPVVLSFACVCVVPIPMNKRQEMLELTDTLERLQIVCGWLSEAIERIDDPSPILAKTLRPMELVRFNRYHCSN